MSPSPAEPVPTLPPPAAGTKLDARDLRELRGTGLLGLCWALLPGLLGALLLWNLGPASQWVEQQGALGRVLYVVVFAVTAGLGLLPTYAQATLGGWVFGFAFGFPAALVGFTFAAWIGYAVARRVAGEHVQHVLDRHPQADLIRRELVGRGGWRAFWVITLLRVPPNSPFSLTNLAFAAVRARLPVYLAGTLIGMAPRTAVYCGFAAAARRSGSKDIQSFVQEGPGWIVFAVGIVLMVAVFAVLGRMANAALSRYGAQPRPTAEDSGP
jgi:uncharacterized membrane protein YdjX (TVP38/TMEM64 family)